jgi:predicted N-acyltransferase
MRNQSLDPELLRQPIEAWPLGPVQAGPASPKARAPSQDARAASEPDSWRVEILDSIHGIAAEAWDEVAGREAVPRSHAYLAAIEAAGINDCRFFYPVIYDAEGRILAHACVYTITTDFLQMLPPGLHGAARGLRRLWPRFLKVLVTECASPLVPGHSISVRDGLARTPLIRRIGSAVGEIARRAGSRLMVVRDFLEHDHADFDALLEDGYHLTSNMPLARIRVRWKSYEDYLDSMRSRYRKDLKRRLEQVERSGQRAVRLPDFAAKAALWAEQVAVMYERSKGFKRERIGARYYEQMAALSPERCIVVAAEREGRSVAHGVILFDDAHTVATYFGRDAGPPGNEWFHLLNEVIRIGIERGSRHICLGLGSYDAKSLLGADVEPLHVYSRSTLPPVNWLMRLVPHTMARQALRPRRIFRDDEPGA